MPDSEKFLNKIKPPKDQQGHDHADITKQSDDRNVLEKIFKSGETAHFRIDGMYCPDCASSIEASLSNEPGIKNVTVSFAGEQGRIDYNPEETDLDSALENLKDIGYHAHLTSDPSEQKIEKERENMLLRLIVAAGFGMQIMLIYLVQLYPLYASGTFYNQNVRNLHYVVWALATPALFIGGSSFLLGAWRAIKAGKVGMNTLVSLGTLSAYSYSVYITLRGGGEVYFDSVAMITTFIMLGRYLEKLGGSQARKDIHHLLQLQPRTARRREEDEWVETKVNRLEVGDKILVKPGERVPADAKVLENSASVNESLLTGESKPVEKQPGDIIYAGTIINDSALIAEVEKLGESTNLGQITNVVESTLNQKPPIQRMADKASKYFALGIVTSAVITFFGWWLTGSTPSQALLNAVAVLVVACPCALGLATPLALAITLGKTAQKGILVRKPSALELAAQVTKIVFDKTGTLTKGNLSVVDVIVNPEIEITKDQLLCIAASVEQFSEHPIARAVVDSCQDSLFEASGFKSERGQGVIGKIKNEGEKEVKVGSKKFLGDLVFSKMSDQAEERTTQGDTVVWVSWDEKVRGFLILRDELEETAPEAVKELKEENIKSSILSGDDPRTVAAIAGELDIENQQGNVSPKEKAAKIKEWQSDGEVVAMIGDGVNDAPGLAQADLSITTASGTDVAGETSDIVFTRSDLKTIPWMIKLSEKTRHIIRENLGWAFAYNLIAVPLAAFGVISPVIAAAAMATSSLLVVGNSLRLR